MEDTEFDKHYAAKMRKAVAPDLSEEDWGPLAATLQARQRRQWRALPLWWLGAVAAVLLGSNLFWWHLWSTQQKAVESLQLAWQQNQPPLPSHQIETVYHYDTIYRTVYVREVLPTVLNIPAVSAPVGDAGLARAQAPVAASESNPVPAPETTTLPGEVSASAAQALSSNVIPPAAPNAVPIPVASYFLHPVPAPLAARHTRAKFFHPEVLVPKKVRLGAFGGMSTPTGSGLSNTFGGSLALNAELLFSEQLALSLDAVYGGFDFTSTTDRADYGFPQVPSPGDDYALQYLSTEESGWAFAGVAAGMRYYLSDKGRWSPYFGLGYGLRWLLPTELEGAFVHTQTGQLKSFSVENESRAPSAAYLDAEIGLRYRLLKRLYWQSAGKFQYKTDQNQAGMPQYWEFRTGAMWAF